LRDAAREVAVRSLVVGQRLAGLGGVGSVGLSAAAAEALGGGWGGRGWGGGGSGRGRGGCAGEPAALAGGPGRCPGRAVGGREVGVDCASHCAQAEPVREELLAALAAVKPTTGQVPFYSTVTGGFVDTASLDAAYWYRNLRAPVAFEPAIRGLIDKGLTCF